MITSFKGTTVLFVMCSMRPEYNERIALAHALAPSVFMKNIRCPLLPLGENGVQLLLPVIKSIPELLPNSDLFRDICLSGKSGEDICINISFMFFGKNPKLFNRTKLPVVLGQAPAGMAMRQFIHYFQLIKSDRFRQYDFELDNKRIYGQNEPPDYDLRRITAPIVLHYSLNDYLSEPVDVIRLSKLLSNVVELHKLGPPLWNHIDFVWAADARKLIYNKMHKLNMNFWVE